MTATTQTATTKRRAPTPFAIFQEPVSWQLIAVVSLLGTAVAVTTTDAMNLCSSMGPAVLVMTWFVMPVIAIASIVTVAAVTPDTTERLIAAALAVTLTTAWMYAFAWASVAQAIQGTTC
jgi:hypothetical protein